MWHVGDSEEMSCRLIVTDTGSASHIFNASDGYGEMLVWVERGSGREYLQSNLLSLSATPYIFPLTFDGSKWDDSIDFVIPATLAGETVYVEKTLYWTGGDIARQWSSSEYVSVADLDDIEQQVIGPGEQFVPYYAD